MNTANCQISSVSRYLESLGPRYLIDAVLFLLLVGGLTIDATAQSPKFSWVSTGTLPYCCEAGGEAPGMVMDHQNNVVLMGSYFQLAVFGSHVLQLENANVHGLYFVKYDPEGGVIWAQSAESYGVGGSTEATNIAIDSQNNIYVSGFFGPSIQFGPLSLSAQRGNAGFLVKYNPQGSVIWARKLDAAGTGEFELVLGTMRLVIDSDDRPHIAGVLRKGVIDLGGILLAANSPGDLFHCVFDAAGNGVWARKILKALRLDGLVADRDGNVALFGGAEEPTAIETNFIAGKSTFFASYNRNGNLSWAKQLNRDDTLVSGTDITQDSGGIIHFLGRFRDHLNIGVTNFDLPPAQASFFEARIDWAGNVLSGSLVDSQFHWPQRMLLDRFGNHFLSGNFSEPAQFEGTVYTPLGAHDGFLAMFDPEWHFIWAKQIGSLGSDTCAETVLDPQGGVLVAGSFQSFSQFDDITIHGTGGPDLYLAKLPDPTGALRPRLLSQPSDQRTLGGGTATFSVDASGYAPLFYRWRHDGEELAPSSQGTLVITNVQAALAGGYSVVVSNSYGMVTSAVVTLTVRFLVEASVNGAGTVLREPALSEYPPGTMVTLTAQPDPGFGFLGWSGDLVATNNPLILVVQGNTRIVANLFYTGIDVRAEGEGRVDKNPDRPYYQPGQTVLLSAVPSRWYRFERWLEGRTDNPREIIIGPGSHYVAVFVATQALETVSYGGVSRIAPVGMPAVVVNGELATNATFSVEGSATVELLSTFPNGVILYTLDGSTPTFSSTLYTGPLTVSRSVALRVVAWDQDFGRFWEADPIRFERASLFALRTISPGGGAISRSPAASAYAPNTVVTLTAVPAQGWTFLHWLGDVAGTNPVAVLTVGRDQEVIGVFGTTLSFSAQGGGRVDAYPLGELFPFGSRVRLTPVPDPGNAFAFWGNAVHGTEQPVVLSVTNASVRVACAFTPLPQGQVFLAVPVSGLGHVEISPAGSRHPMGDPVILTAFPDQDEEFRGWAGDLVTNDNPLRVTLNTSLTVRARFSARPRLLARGFAAPISGEPLLFHLTGEPGALYRIDRAEQLPPLWRFSHWITNTFGQSEWRETWNAAAGPRLFRAVPAP